MSIFGSIMNAITFGAYKNKTGEVHPAATAAPAAAPAQAAIAPAAAPAPVAPPPLTDVDVEATLAKLAESHDLNWRTSIVDLMKLLSVDASLDNRKSLAQELGYTGALDGSAEMNIWLHKATMHKLAENGGKVPASMTD
jgi:3-oxoacyl-ACP reductase-like protein